MNQQKFTGEMNYITRCLIDEENRKAYKESLREMYGFKGSVWIQDMKKDVR
jgi:hypothetical protein